MYKRQIYGDLAVVAWTDDDSKVPDFNADTNGLLLGRTIVQKKDNSDGEKDDSGDTLLDDDDDEKDLPKIIRRRPSAKPAAPEEFDEEETSPKASMGDTKPYTSPSKPQITEDGIPDVDLSAIRQQISEEVQRIYEDDQNS